MRRRRRSRLVTPRRIHGFLVGFWVLMTIPSVLWWRQSVPYLVFISVYALVASHAAAYAGSKAEEATR